MLSNSLFLKNLHVINFNLFAEEVNKGLNNSLLIKLGNFGKDRPLKGLSYICQELDNILSILTVSYELALAPEIVLDKNYFGSEQFLMTKLYKNNLLNVYGNFIENLEKYRKQDSMLNDFIYNLEKTVQDIKYTLEKGILSAKINHFSLYKDLSMILQETYLEEHNICYTSKPDMQQSVLESENLKSSPLLFFTDKLIYLENSLDAQGIIFRPIPYDSLIFLNDSKISYVEYPLSSTPGISSNKESNCTILSDLSQKNGYSD